MGAFYCLFARKGNGYLAGLLAGMAAITNYVAAVPVAMLGVYLLVTRWRTGGAVRTALWYGLGLAGPLVAICAYNMACYGSPFALSNAFQNPAFIEEGGRRSWGCLGCRTWGSR